MSASIAAGVIKAAVEVSKKNPLPSAMAPARSRLSAFAEKAQRDKYKGISRARWATQWHAEIPLEPGKQVGPFSDAEQAARVHDVSVLKLHQTAAAVDPADLNFPHEEYDEADIEDVRKLSPSQFLMMLDHYASVRCDVAKQSGSRYAWGGHEKTGEAVSKEDSNI
eukprot:jgi/Tetstr1/450011/TSEL_003931.t1